MNCLRWCWVSPLTSIDSETASRSAAVGLCGLRPVPGRGHAASIPDASGRGHTPGLRAALAFLTPAGVVGLAC